MSSPGDFFFLYSMPASRPADYCLGWRRGSVFIDFDNEGDDDAGRVRLVRISFDGYGCCNLPKDESVPLDEAESAAFKRIVSGGLKGEDQDALLALVRRALALNRGLVWPDALECHGLA
jgi:hypothetical protein